MRGLSFCDLEYVLECIVAKEIGVGVRKGFRQCFRSLCKFCLVVLVFDLLYFVVFSALIKEVHLLRLLLLLSCNNNYVCETTNCILVKYVCKAMNCIVLLFTSFSFIIINNTHTHTPLITPPLTHTSYNTFLSQQN